MQHGLNMGSCNIDLNIHLLPTGRYMKKGFMVWALLMWAAWAQAQMGIAERSVPGIIMNDFQYRFVDAENVSWVKLANNHYGAKFVFRNQKTEAVYEEGGTWLQSVMEIPFEYLPEDAQKYCRSYHGGSKMRSIQQISSRSYGILYDVSLVEDLRNYVITFDQYGKKTEVRELEDIVVDEPAEKKKLNIGGFMKKWEE
jgi:hypothetical protein